MEKEMANKIDDLAQDVGEIKDTLPRSWKKNSNGHDAWNDLCDEVEEMHSTQKKFTKSAKWVLGLIGLGVLTTVGLLVEDLYGEVKKTFFNDRAKTTIKLERDFYTDREELIKRIENGKYDSSLRKLMKIELKNDNRQSVLKAIAARMSKISNREVDFKR